MASIQPLVTPKSQLEPARYNLRVLEELPWQLAKCVSGVESGWPLQVLRTTVATLAFMEAACASDMVVGVLRSFSYIEAELQAELASHWHFKTDNAGQATADGEGGRTIPLFLVWCQLMLTILPSWITPETN